MNVMDAARNVAEDYPGGATSLAPRIDKNPTTLNHELHETGAAKLGLVTAVKITSRTKDLRILNAFAAEVGCMVLPLPIAQTADSAKAMADLAAMAKEFSDVVMATSAACADGRVTDNELHGVERQAGELVAAVQAMLASLQAMNEAGKRLHRGLLSVAASTALRTH